jgi:hypothetical protein
MKKYIYILFFCTAFQFGFSQEKKVGIVEKSIFGIQTGTLGCWIHNEYRVLDDISLRSEIGIDFGLIGGEIRNSKTDLIVAPSINIEPRWYYNLKQRASDNKNTSKNSANFITLGIKFLPNVSTNKYNVVSQISFIPKWGIRRSIGEHFTFETGIGLGYFKFLDSNYTSNKNLALDLHLRLGYTF